MITKRALRRELDIARRIGASLIQRNADLRDHLYELQNELDTEKVGPARSNRKKLSGGMVAVIRGMVLEDGKSQKEVAALYGVNPATISRIIRGIYH